MSLKDVVVEKGFVTYGGTEIELHGINANDIKTIVTRNRLSVDLMFDIAERKGIKSATDINEDNIREVANTAIAELPDLVAAIIAQCSGDIHDLPIAAKLPIPVQFDCLRTIARLTFSDATNFGEFLGNVIAAARMVRTAPSIKEKALAHSAQPANAGTEQ